MCYIYLLLTIYLNHVIFLFVNSLLSVDPPPPPLRLRSRGGVLCFFFLSFFLRRLMGGWLGQRSATDGRKQAVTCWGRPKTGKAEKEKQEKKERERYLQRGGGACLQAGDESRRRGDLARGRKNQTEKASAGAVSLHFLMPTSPFDDICIIFIVCCGHQGPQVWFWVEPVCMHIMLCSHFHFSLVPISVHVWSLSFSCSLFRFPYMPSSSRSPGAPHFPYGLVSVFPCLSCMLVMIFAHMLRPFKLSHQFS